MFIRKMIGIFYFKDSVINVFIGEKELKSVLHNK